MTRNGYQVNTFLTRSDKYANLLSLISTNPRICKELDAISIKVSHDYTICTISPPLHTNRTDRAHVQLFVAETIEVTDVEKPEYYPAGKTFGVEWLRYLMEGCVNDRAIRSRHFDSWRSGHQIAPNHQHDSVIRCHLDGEGALHYVDGKNFAGYLQTVTTYSPKPFVVRTIKRP